MTDKPCTHFDICPDSMDTDFRIFSGEYFAKCPPVWAWICAKCLTTGDMTVEECPQTPMPRLYWKLILKKDPDAHVPAFLKGKVDVPDGKPS